VDVLPGIGRNIFDDVGGYVVSDGLLLSVHTRQQQGVMGVAQQRYVKSHRNVL
jgi:hypothetical protein